MFKFVNRVMSVANLNSGQISKITSNPRYTNFIGDILEEHGGYKLVIFRSKVAYRSGCSVSVPPAGWREIFFQGSF